MNAPALVSPNLLSSLTTFYPDTVTIQSATVARGAAGSEVKAWADVTGLVNIPCAIAPLSVTRDTSTLEVRAALQTYGVITHHMALQGLYTGIDNTMQAVSGGITYDITGVEHDSHSAMTRVWLREVTN